MKSSKIYSPNKASIESVLDGIKNKCKVISIEIENETVEVMQDFLTWPEYVITGIKSIKFEIKMLEEPK